MRTTVRAWLVMVGSAAVTACGGAGGGGAEPAPEVLEGEIMLTGSEPGVMVTLLPAEGEAVVLSGPLTEELRRLSGVVVSVRGRPTRPAPMRGMAVTGYEIVSVGGERPVVGVLVERDGEVWLDGERAVRLVAVPAGLRARVGATVWVVGAVVADGLQPRSYGVIRNP